ncbi:PAS domain-containing protein [Hymenobacter oligotrophus]|uniref:PAS domain-containing protein n=1 Tax=Hymenobacter oligotrophus TaxID=2319843 RepID=UPI0013C3385B|nr:PAS domain-containing protein [Hymenobacter oligotrophus]
MPASVALPELLPVVLDVSLSGYIVFRPVYDPADQATIVDLAYEYLNPAAQRMLQRPERPAETFLTLYPNTIETGIFAFYRDTFLAGGPGRYDVNYQHDGLDNYFQLAAHRAGEVLVVCFSDTADQPRTAVEEALRQSQVREQQARAEAEAQRRRLHDVLMALPAQVSTFNGPEHVYELVNPRYQQLFPSRPVQGLPIRQALPELAGQGIIERLDRVYQTGEPHVDPELETWVDRTGTGRLEQCYFSVLLQALRDAEGRVDGLLNFAYDVTEQVQARRQVQQLNQELESRVLQRTQEAEAARAEAEAVARRLQRITESLPSTTFTVDEHGQILYVSPQYYAYTGLAPSLPMGQDQPAHLGPVGQGWPELIHPDDLPLVAREYGGALAQGHGWRYEFRLRGADGRYRWFASQGVPEPLEDARAAGRPRQWFGSNLDIDDLKRAQHELELQDQRLREILRQSPAMIASVEGPNHRFAFTNPGYDAMVGQRARPGATVAECLPELAAQGFVELLDEVYRTGQPHIGREALVVLESAGSGPAPHYFDFTYQPLPDAQGQTTGVLAFIVDATERVQARQRADEAQAQALAAAEQAAAQRESFYRVFEQTPACIALLRGPEFRYEYANPAYQALFPDRPLLGRTVAEAFPETVEQGFLAWLDGVYQTGQTYVGQEAKFTAAPAVGLPPQDTYYDITYQAIREGEQITGISIFAFDVTERVRARKEREAQRRQLLNLFEQAPAGIAILAGPSMAYEFINPSYQRLVPNRALLGLPFLEALPELADNPVTSIMRNVYATGQAHEERELLIPVARTLEGEPENRYFSFVYQPRRNEHNQVDGLLVFVFEVTEQVQARQQVLNLNEELKGANAELAAANQQLTRTNIDLDNFVYTASHDLKAPISNLDGLLALLRHELPAEVAQSEYVAPTLSHMRDAVERFKRTIDQLTDVSRLQKEHSPAAVAVDLAAVVDDVCQDLAPLLRETNARLTVAVANFPAVLFSEKNLRSVVFNLLSNALKYRHPARRPHVDVRAHVRTGYTVLEVHDNGLGLDAAQLPRLFAMFQRFHSHVEGTGIGLFMVKRMVENAGGRIEVHSQPGAGTTFFVHLPHAPGPAVVA